MSILSPHPGMVGEHHLVNRICMGDRRWQLTNQEQTDPLLTVTTLDRVVIGEWYFSTGLFYALSSVEHRASVERLFANLRTPIDPKAEGIENHEEVLRQMMGLLCLTYGTFIMLLVFIPNSTNAASASSVVVE